MVDKRVPGFLAATGGVSEIDARYRLTGVVISRSGDYRVETTELDTYLVPKRPQVILVDALHHSRRGVGYTKSLFAFLFTRTAKRPGPGASAGWRRSPS